MKHWIALCAAASVSSCAPSVLPDPLPVVEAERAFAKDGYDLGFKPSFLKWSAGDAILLQPDPTNAHDSLNAAPDPQPGEDEPKLVWWPLFAGISKSGDLGFTTGPYEFAGERRGHYFTVWKKQSDGGWKWVFDGGVGADPKGEAGADAEPTYLATSGLSSASPEAAVKAVVEAESKLAKEAETDAVAAVASRMAPVGRVHTRGEKPAKATGEYETALAARGRSIAFAHISGGSSVAGDLVWTIGDAAWQEGEDSRRGHYVRVWQKQRDGWKIVFDQIVPNPPTPA
jgi:ketosteroid isomerase-like protein